MKAKLIAAAVTLSLGAGIAAEAFAQEKPENYIRFRKATQTLSNWQMRQMRPMVQGKQPFNAASATRAANVIATLAPVFASAFPEGTNQGNTRALPEIWSEPEKFKQAMDRYLADTNKLLEVAKSGDAEAFKTQFGALAKTCDSCHNDFRKKR